MYFRGFSWASCSLVKTSLKHMFVPHTLLKGVYFQKLKPDLQDLYTFHCYTTGLSEYLGFQYHRGV